MSTGIVLTSCNVRVSMMYALFARVPPVTTYRPSGDIITMWGFTLLPRKVRPSILRLLMSMNPISFESRFTMRSTDAGSVTLTPWAPRVAPTAAPAMMSPATMPRRRALDMIFSTSDYRRILRTSFITRGIHNSDPALAGLVRLKADPTDGL